MTDPIAGESAGGLGGLGGLNLPGAAVLVRLPRPGAAGREWADCKVAVVTVIYHALQFFPFVPARPLPVSVEQGTS